MTRPRLLFVIPHYAAPDARRHGSAVESTGERAAKLSAVIARLHAAFPANVTVLGFDQRLVAESVLGRPGHELDIAVVTNGTDHVLDQLTVDPGLYRHVPTGEDPQMLGFAARSLLGESESSYDWFGYIEDDILIEDPALLAKLAWFDQLSGPHSVLLPHRYEATDRDDRGTAYIDGDFVTHHTDQWQVPVDDARPQTIHTTFAGHRLRFQRASNPHAGCFVLNAAQLRQWQATPYLDERDVSFSSPLESAATLGLLKVFAVYKPALDDVPFYEVRHLGERYLAEVVPPAVTVREDGSAPYREAALRAEVDRLRRDVWRLEAEYDQLQDQLGEVYASTSWRVTKPLRQVVDTMRDRTGRATASSEDQPRGGRPA